MAIDDYEVVGTGWRKDGTSMPGHNPPGAGRKPGPFSPRERMQRFLGAMVKRKQKGQLTPEDEVIQTLLDVMIKKACEFALGGGKANDLLKLLEFAEPQVSENQLRAKVFNEVAQDFVEIFQEFVPPTRMKELGTRLRELRSRYAEDDPLFG